MHLKPNKAAKLGLSGTGSRRDVFDRVRFGTVAIGTGPPAIVGQPFDLKTVTILGTGFVVDDRGIALTAKHVIEPMFTSLQAMTPAQMAVADQIKVVTEGPPSIVGTTLAMNWIVSTVVQVRMSNELDFAVVTFGVDAKNQGTFKALALAKDPCRQGDEVGVCGYPFGQQLHADVYNNQPAVIPSFSAGIVSVVFPHPDTPPEFQGIFQMDAMINGGNSGGPVFNPGTGEVVGIVTSSVNVPSRVLQDPSAGPNEDKPGPMLGPASGFFKQQLIPTGLSRGVHVHQSRQFIKDAIAALP